MAGGATFGFYRRVFEDEGSMLVDVAFETDRGLRRRGAHLLWSNRAVWIVAVRALDQALIYTMAKWHIELGFLL